MNGKPVLALALVSMLLLCEGCQIQSTEGEVLSSTGEQVSNNGKVTHEDGILKICTDSGCKDSARQLVDVWERLNHNSRAELIVIPQDTSAAETMISEMRTETLSGKGPDVFLLQCANPNTADDLPLLFSNPEKMMYSDVFLPLDSLMEKAEYLKTENLNPKILEAGKTQEGRMILPVCYDYYVYAFPENELTIKEKISSWKDLMDCNDPKVMSAVSSRIFSQFYDIPGKYVDYDNEEPVLTEKELLQLAEEAADYQEKGWKFVGEEETLPNVYSLGDGMFSDLEKDAKNAHVIFGLANTEGGITANITLYAAINRNTQQPEKAFSFLDLLFSDEITSGKGFSDGDAVFGNLITFPEGFSICNHVLEKACSRISEEDAKAVKEMNERINAVRFHCDLDKEMNDLFRKVSGTDDERERENEVNQVYDKIWMILSE